jgi:hypothetical protein
MAPSMILQKRQLMARSVYRNEIDSGSASELRGDVHVIPILALFLESHSERGRRRGDVHDQPIAQDGGVSWS